MGKTAGIRVVGAVNGGRAGVRTRSACTWKFLWRFQAKIIPPAESTRRYGKHRNAEKASSSGQTGYMYNVFCLEAQRRALSRWRNRG